MYITKYVIDLYTGNIETSIKWYSYDNRKNEIRKM